MTRRHGRPLSAAPFARHKGDHRRRLLAGVMPGRNRRAPEGCDTDDFSRPRAHTTPLALFPMAADLDAIPVYSHPYAPSRGAA